MRRNSPDKVILAESLSGERVEVAFYPFYESEIDIFGGKGILVSGRIMLPSSSKSSGEVGGRGREVGEHSDHPQSVLPLNWGGIELKRTVTCMVLKATANDRRYLALCHDEFRGPRSDLCQSGGISTNNNKCISATQCIL
ncbi:uncharacterized protein TNCV_3756131 [Trichonephila clavipes]|nr:uncharacterized protein TNCV_3756131 [Trichonephila clavipes]